MRPSVRSEAIASRTTVRLTWNRAISSCSVGRRSPARRRPERMSRPILSASCAVRLSVGGSWACRSGLSGMTRPFHCGETVLNVQFSTLGAHRGVGMDQTLGFELGPKIRRDRLMEEAKIGLDLGHRARARDDAGDERVVEREL